MALLKSKTCYIQCGLPMTSNITSAHILSSSFPTPQRREGWIDVGRELLHPSSIFYQREIGDQGALQNLIIQEVLRIQTVSKFYTKGNFYRKRWRFSAISPLDLDDGF